MDHHVLRGVWEERQGDTVQGMHSGLRWSHAGEER